MRRIRIAAVAVMVVAGFIGAVAAPASAAKPFNYGTCVSGVPGLPSDSNNIFGPYNTRADVASGGQGGSANHAYVRSDGNSRFVSGLAC
jgi:hypothetical protein